MNRVLLTCADSILSFSSVFLSSLLHNRCVWCDTISSNHPIVKPFSHCCFSPLLTPYNTSFLFCKSSVFTSHRITVWLCVVGCLPSCTLLLLLLPSFLGEGAYALGARGGNSPARRGDRGETLLINRSADNFPVCAKGHQSTTALPPPDFTIFCSSWYFRGTRNFFF